MAADLSLVFDIDTMMVVIFPNAQWCVDSLLNVLQVGQLVPVRVIRPCWCLLLFWRHSSG